MDKICYHITNENAQLAKNEIGITCEEQFQTVVFSEDNAYILLNIHLSWNHQKYSSNYGFDIAQQLRLVKKTKSPIVLYSPLPQTYFELLSKTNIKYHSLFSPGTRYIEAPITKNKFFKLLEQVQPISNETLADINRTLLNVKGLVLSKLTHDLKFEKFNSLVFDEVKPYLNEEQIQQIQLNYFKSLLSCASTEQDFNGFKEQFFSICNLYLQYDNSTNLLDLPKKHTILLVDDYFVELDKIKKVFENNFHVIKTNESIEAIKELKKDVQNKIVAVISDWRLFKDEQQTYWQDYQGYDVLRTAAESGLRVLVTLTSFNESVVESTKNMLQLNIELKNKNILNDIALISEFKNWLYIKCDDVLNHIANIPDSDNWKKNERAIDSSELKTLLKNKTPGITSESKTIKYKPLHQQYLTHLYADRFSFYKSIDAKAKEILNYINEYFIKNNTYNKIEPLRSKFGIYTQKSPQIYSILVLRRIWLALYFLVETDDFSFSKRKVYAIIQNLGREDDSSSNKADVEMNKLCLTKNQVIDKVLLPEEKNWLIKQNLL